MTGLVLGPLVRHVDADSAVVWVETDEATTVRVQAGEHSASAATFGVHGHHYALVDVAGLPPGTPTAYTLDLDGTRAWPPPDSPYPSPVLATLDPGQPLRLAFGSCRTSVDHDAGGNATHGVDAMRAYALRMAGLTDAGGDDPDADPMRATPRHGSWPDLVLFLGDQVYADETTDAMRRFISSRRDIEQAPWTELADYQEYAELYRLAWSDPANRWLLSTLPSLMIFDDHDIRDDWNTSYAWKQRMEATDWWHDRIVAGLGSYWVYQHIGNLAPRERGEEPLWRRVAEHAAAVAEGRASGELDLSEALDELADRADQDPTTYRWSFSRDFGTQARLVVIDSRAARVLEPGDRSLLDDEELAWLDARMRGEVDHLLVGTSVPFLLAPGLHDVEAFTEALAAGAWGKRAAAWGERIRQEVDLEHWAAFQDGFRQVAHMTAEVAAGERGRAPETVTFLAGDVHHSYVSEAVVREGTGHGRQRSRIIQAVCSPIRNPLPRQMRYATAVASYGVAGVVGRAVAASAKVPKAELVWGLLRGPWFDNNLATLEITDDGLRMWWATGRVVADDHERPILEQVADVLVQGPAHGPGPRLPDRRDRAQRWRRRTRQVAEAARKNAADVLVRWRRRAGQPRRAGGAHRRG